MGAKANVSGDGIQIDLVRLEEWVKSKMMKFNMGKKMPYLIIWLKK